MTISLAPIPQVKPEWQIAHKVRALALDNVSPAVAQLYELHQKHPEDYHKLMATIKLVAMNKRVHNPKRVKRSARNEGVYEMKGGQSRLFFFYDPDDDSVVICTHLFWKAKSSKREQDFEFRRCARLLDAYRNRPAR